jgi:hypothetical protein
MLGPPSSDRQDQRNNDEELRIVECGLRIGRQEKLAFYQFAIYNPHSAIPC